MIYMLNKNQKQEPKKESNNSKEKKSMLKKIFTTTKNMFTNGTSEKEPQKFQTKNIVNHNKFMAILEEINTYLIKLDIQVEASCEIIIFLSKPRLNDIIHLLEIQ